MAAHGEVLALKRRLGFGSGDRVEHFVVLQSDRFTAHLETVVAAPLDAAMDVYAGDPASVRVTAREAGTRADQVVLVALLAALPTARFEPAPVGQLDRPSIVSVSRVLRLLFELS